MCEVGLPLHKQLIKGITSTLAIQHFKGRRMKLVHISCLPWSLVGVDVRQTMRSNHSYTLISLSIYQWLHVCAWSTIPLHKQPNKGITSISTMQHFKGVPSRDWWKLAHFNLCIVWCMMYHDLQSFILIFAPLSIYQWVYVWVWYIIVQATNQGDHIKTDHTTPQGYAMGRWMKTVILLTFVLVGVQWTISSNHS